MHRTLILLRKALRLKDNPLLVEACCGSEVVLPCFFMDRWHRQEGNLAPSRKVFLCQTLKELDVKFRKSNNQLYYFEGEPMDLLPKICEEARVSRIIVDSEEENEPHCSLELLKKWAESVKIKVVDISAHMLHNQNDYGRERVDTYRSFYKIFSSLGAVPLPLDPPKTMPPGLKLSFQDPLPSVIDETAIIKGGEDEALKRLYHLNSDWLCSFDKTKTSPTCSLEDASTALLSPYITHGCISVRVVWYHVDKILRQSRHTRPPVSFLGQILWREFWYYQAFRIQNFDQMKGNSVCLQINWSDNSDFLKKWRDGQTGYPFIDALMRQLKQTGWIHHLGRHAVACFLTRGDLWQSWEKGAYVFDRFLIDADWSLNNANWQWVSCSAFFHQYFRVYSPVSFGKKYDPTGLWVKKWVPEVRYLPKEYVFEPWKAPMEIQKKAKCIIGKDYPFPLISDHISQSKENMQKMKKIKVDLSLMESSPDDE